MKKNVVTLPTAVGRLFAPANPFRCAGSLLVLGLLLLMVACNDHKDVTPASQPPAPAGFRHAFAQVNGINLHYVTGGTGELVVLLHGFPQTWYEWAAIMPQLGQQYTVIAADLRGGGLSDKPIPANGYDKKLLAEDIHQLVKQLGYTKVRVVGHDIGMMVAYAYAALYPNEVSKLVVMDAPLPGIEPSWSYISSLAIHFKTFQVRGYENTYVGQERPFLDAFYKMVGYRNTNPFSATDFDVFLTAYTGAANLRGGFEWYRGFPTDSVDNQRFQKTKLTMPVLALGGDESAGAIIVPLMSSVATNVTGGSVNGSIPQSGHWLLESQPAIVLRELQVFLAK
jgi:pimeloyl-ACP methyl ester carboxylesterase